MMKLAVMIALSLSIILGFLFWRFSSQLTLFPNTPAGPVTLNIWGFWEEGTIKPVIEQYRLRYPNINITYHRQSLLNYRTRVQTQIREGAGPDVFPIHNSWLSMFSTDLYPAPADIFSLDGYSQDFYPVAQNSFAVNGQIFAAPLETGGLGLYINEELLVAAGVEPPKIWPEFVSAAFKLTVRDAEGKIQSAGAGMGTTSNVDFWQDILGLLLVQQPGVDFKNLNTPRAAEILKFYTAFIIDPGQKTWDATMPATTEAFIQGRLAFYFAPYTKAGEIRQANPNLKFRVVPVPKLQGRNIAWASFWGGAVSKMSKHPQAAWDFIKYLTSAEVQRLLFGEISQKTTVGFPYARTDLALELDNDPILTAFVIEGPYYKWWYLASGTGDLGINGEMSQVFETGITAVLQGADAAQAMTTIDSGVKEVLNKYQGQ